MAGVEDVAALAEASGRALPEDDSSVGTPNKSLWAESTGPAGPPVTLGPASANPRGISVDFVMVLKQIEEMKIAMEKLQAENQQMKAELDEAPGSAENAGTPGRYKDARPWAEAGPEKSMRRIVLPTDASEDS